MSSLFIKMSMDLTYPAGPLSDLIFLLSGKRSCRTNVVAPIFSLLQVDDASASDHNQRLIGLRICKSAFQLRN